MHIKISICDLSYPYFSTKCFLFILWRQRDGIEHYMLCVLREIRRRRDRTYVDGQAEAISQASDGKTNECSRLHGLMRTKDT